MFDALKALGNPFELMKKAREMQDRMQQVQDELSKKQVTADAGGGMVSATVNGKLELIKIQIDKSRVNPNDSELLEDVIVAAVSAAQAKAAGIMQEEMQKMAADAGLPPGLLPQR
jgi:nucleoid-associated protein EbfC